MSTENRPLTFPHGESQDGSPGLDAFHTAKSLTLFFSPSLSSDTLSSPAEKKTNDKFRNLKTLYYITHT